MGKSPFLEGSNEGGRRRMVEMLNLPVDMIKEILLWLPVKSLLRFRCVSKDWRCLITDSSFINQHHNRSTEKKPNLILTDTRSFYTVKDNSCHKLDIPYLNSLDWSYKIKVLGSCNSLLCFGLLAAGVFPVTIHYREPIYLMNLSTREVKKLPYAPSEIPQSTDWKTRIGIGYDPISKDYKVVLSVYSNIMFRSCNVWVYSLNSNNWRKLGDIPVPDLYPKTYNYSQSALAFNAAIHWIVFWKNELIGSLWNSIYSFDLVDEVFRE
ncbi:F-box/kelch-repeat protein At3g23880-like [Macadamia integrifolia]|uniref:F-box/kelch-repeat protein At3g23880-like n=1 Tax=Macadamia integrifolia TaxID=60698 RepID=UPI001C52782B|nr:F-box/kelch-repeat protein At3g23880-like [Macadamia integrifolia]